MAQQQVFEGTGEQLQEHLKQYPYERFRLILLSSNGANATRSNEPGLRRGLFPQLRGLTEEDFQVAEWYGEEVDL